jgi:glyoxylase-like metal-dependent hydrolase (beta-lactamase superfamily II)
MPDASLPAHESILDLSARLIDERITSVKVNRVTLELSELGDGLALVEAFSHVYAVATDAGLVCFDTSARRAGPPIVAALRLWNQTPFSTLVYTHGHVDHVGGSGAFAADAADRGDPAPSVIGHSRVGARFERYRLTNGYNSQINARQFGGRPSDDFLDPSVLAPTRVVEAHTDLTVGSHPFALHHALGETDDHLWTWDPARRAIFSGDLMTWAFPNAGNPQKVQRFPAEWARALRDMASLEPELLLPAHGLPIAGRDRIRFVLATVAEALERLVAAVIERMNAGIALDAIVHEVKVPADVLALPFLRATYDEPEFVVRNIWRLYGGWWGGDVDRLKPSPAAVLARELAGLAGGPVALAKRAEDLAGEAKAAIDRNVADDRWRLASHLIELAAESVDADTDDFRRVHEIRADVYAGRRQHEQSLMAKGVFGSAADESTAALTGSSKWARRAVFDM